MNLNIANQQTSQIRYLEKILQEHMALFGYEQISLPFIEAADIFLTRAGDKIIDCLFTFDRLGQQLALRPEFTAAAAHHYVTQQETGVARWQFSGPIFEDAPDDHTLDYQKYSIGAECIGLAGGVAEADAIAMAVQGITKLGLENWQLVIGHVGLQLYLLSRYDLDSRTYRLLLAQRETLKDPQRGKDAALDHIHDLLTISENDVANGTLNQQADTQTQHMLDVLLDSTRYGTTMGGRTRNDIAQRLLNKRERALEYEQITAALDFLHRWVNLRAPLDEAFPQIADWIGDDPTGQAILNTWQETLNLLDIYGIERDQIIIQADLTKNWEYYTGLVFGVEIGEDNYVVGGGRYDDLTRVLGSQNNVPAFGFAYYIDNLLPMLNITMSENSSVTIQADANAHDAIRWATYLRNNGVSIALDENVTNELLITIKNGGACLKNRTYTWSEKESLLKELKALF